MSDCSLGAGRGWALSLGGFLVTRMLELACTRTIWASASGWPRQISRTAFDPVLVLLARLAARRHGQAALRALAGAERASAAINAI